MQGNKTINQYVILGKLGSGAYSKVKLCMNTEDNELYHLLNFLIWIAIPILYSFSLSNAYSSSALF